MCCGDPEQDHLASNELVAALHVGLRVCASVYELVMEL